jgi:hypothetical protein
MLAITCGSFCLGSIFNGGSREGYDLGQEEGDGTEDYWMSISS